MENYSIKNKRTGLFTTLLVINLAALAIWIVGQTINVYRFAAVGAIYELLWLPTLAAIVSIPFVSIYFWHKDNFKSSSKFLLLMCLSLLSIIAIFTLTIF